jgi:hypothetical protein
MKKMQFILLLLLAGTIQSLAQQSEGPTNRRRLVVVDLETLIPVAGANVVSNESTQTTDSAGYVSVSDNCRTLSFSHVNYESRLINLNEVRDTVFLISKLLNLKEVIVFGKGKKRDYSELQRRLGLDKVEAQLISGGKRGMDLIEVFNYLFVPKKWRKSYRRKQRMKRLKETLDSY